MREYIARLIDTGMPRDTAVCVCRIFKREHGLRELERYVEDVEAECVADV